MRFVDALIASPANIPADLCAGLLAEFSPPEVVELAATLTAAIAFSKAAVVFGAPPDMPVLSSSPGPSPGRGPHQIRTRRFPPSGSSVDATRGYGPQIRTVIRGRGNG